MKLVCIDTHVLIWGVRKKAGATQQDMVARTAQLLDGLDAQNAKVIVPMQCVTEFLCGEKEANYGSIVQTLHDRFMVTPFDTLAAIATARIRTLNKHAGLIDKVREENPDYSRQQVIVDHMIVGLAVSRKAEVLYSDDGPLRKFAGPHITVMNIPLAKETQKLLL